MCVEGQEKETSFGNQIDEIRTLRLAKLFGKATLGRQSESYTVARGDQGGARFSGVFILSLQVKNLFLYKYFYAVLGI